MRFRAFLFVALVAWTWPSQVDAQIYAWRDVNGTLVLSDRSIDAPTTVYKVSGTPSYVTTRPAEDDGVSEDSRYEPLIQEHATRRALRPELVRAVIQVESGFNARALSPKGTMGLMQLMPATARSLGVNNPWDPAQNIRGGTDYLRQLLDEYDGNEELALAAYNAGAGAVAKYGRRIPPYRETRDYVRKVGAAAGEGPVASRKKLIIYKTIEVLDGRAVPRYSSERPTSGSFQIVSR
ncbi:MAG TPA: lytic transglycosylase domain-containing protein [Vicinamibacterales bacterium]|nr:lytic transglycosylase domain-containing protein [Vicinamibacterales bacterium]